MVTEPGAPQPTSSAAVVPPVASQPQPPASHSAPQSEPSALLTPKLPKRRRRPRRVSDTITVIVPLDVTADLGVAVRRARAKRIRKLREMHPEIFPGKRKRDGSGEEDDEAAAVDEDEDDEEEKKGGSDEPKRKKKKKSVADGGGAGGGDDEEDEELGSAPLVPRKEQYGSVLDYLEAKYVRGVMIAGPDDRPKKKKKKAKKSSGEGGGGGEKDAAGTEDVDDDDDDDDSEMEGSIYSDSEGSFLDDSLLRSEVAGQVLASGAYGTTKVEEERRKAKEAEKRERQKREGSGGEDQDEENDEDIDADQSDDFDDNDAFFVNVGDLEMAEGFDEGEIDYGWDDAGTKKKKKKTRKRKSSSAVPASSATPKKGGAKKAKSSKESTSAASPPKPTKKKVKTAASTKPASKVSSQNEAVPKKKKKEKAKKAAPPSNSENEDEEESDEKEESGEGSDEEKDEDDSGEEVRDDDNVSTKSDDSAGKAKREAQRKERVAKAKADASNLKSMVERLYNIVVERIKELTDKELPRKRKGTVKVSITVPASKGPGDVIMFANPHMPGQKLKMKVPRTGRPGGKVVVSVPLPEVKEGEKENVFPPPVREALDDYSQAYDDWCDAEARRRDLEPGLEPFKPGKERLKKFDDLVDEFPPDLAIPIDVVELRKVVRRTRQNISKRRKSAAAILGSGGSDGDGGAGTLGGAAAAKRRTYEDRLADIEAPPPMLQLRLPGKGTTFPSIQFDDDDFNH
mmetsp:Transcript_21973/g.64972  ORF Transcript_21973/g.64972 Transcript_21973/m.64972 type:complete len:740 (-) Transcript_21973:234-2453(-)